MCPCVPLVLMHAKEPALQSAANILENANMTVQDTIQPRPMAIIPIKASAALKSNSACEKDIPEYRAYPRSTACHHVRFVYERSHGHRQGIAGGCTFVTHIIHQGLIRVILFAALDRT